MMTDPPWLVVARQSIGLAETPGKQTTPQIRKWLVELRAWWQDDETPWCGVAVAAWMNASGVKLPRHWYRARDWLNWGAILPDPVLGSVVICARGAGSGHVALAVGRDTGGRLLLLGGNQGNRVSVMPFLDSRVIGVRWPTEHVAMLTKGLPVLASTSAPSNNEA